MKALFNPAIAIFALVLPGAALANVTGTPTLNSGQTLSLDTGTVGSSGGDILFTGTGISFQSSAKGVNLTTASGGAESGSTTFNALISAGASSFSFFSFSSASITPLTAGTIIAYQTNGGNTGALLINTVTSTTSVSIQFVTFESTTPTITQVLNNYSLVPAGFSNSAIAPGALFIIKGSNLASATSVSSLESTTGGSTLPTTLNGASVKVTVGSTSVTPAFYYAENIQLALVMPSNTPLGAGTVTVTYNGQTSNAFSITVASSAFGFAAYYGAGSGLAHVQNLSYGYYSYNSSIPPGATIRLIGSGLGADPTRDIQYVQPTAASAINALSSVYVGGVQANIFYQGPEGFPGVDEIDVTIPSNAPTGCYVSIVGVTAATGLPTNTLTLPIGNGPCSDPGLGFSGSTLTSLSGQTNVRTGFVGLAYSTSPNESGTGTQVNTEAFASFQQYTGAGYGAGLGIVSIGGCIITESLGSAAAIGTTTPLNAGTITVSSPNAGISPVQLAGNSFIAGYYTAQLPSGFLTQAGGAFPISATAGTTAPLVGAFNTQVTFPTPLLAWTNQAADATVVRASGVTATWSGGSPGTYVEISGDSIGSSTFGSFTCLAPVAAGTFTVPPYVLGALPASTTGSLSVGNYTVPQTFTATGLDYGFAEGYVSYQINAVYK